MGFPVINNLIPQETDPFLATEAADFSTPTSAFGSIVGGIGDVFTGLMGAGQSILSSPDALTGIAGGLLTKEAYDRLSDIGEQAKREAMGIAERGQAESQFRPFTVTTPTGAMFTTRMGGQPVMPSGFGQPMPRETFGYGTGSDLQPLGQPSMMLPPGMGMGMEQALKPLPYIDTMPVIQGPTEEEMRADRQRFLAMSPQDRQRFEQLGGISPLQQPVLPSSDGLQIGMELSPEEQALQQQLLGGAGQFFGQAQAPTTTREQQIFARMKRNLKSYGY
jgi:hypothetical protein